MDGSVIKIGKGSWRSQFVAGVNSPALARLKYQLSIYIKKAIGNTNLEHNWSFKLESSICRLHINS